MKVIGEEKKWGEGIRRERNYSALIRTDILASAIIVFSMFAQKAARHCLQGHFVYVHCS
jgi:hypothetical protein